MVGIDFGTLSGRALVVRVSDGAEVGTAVHEYRHGVIDTTLPATGAAAAAGLGAAGPERLPRRAPPRGPGRRRRTAGVAPEQVVGIGIDFTACTILPTLADGTPLCELPDLRGRPHAYVKLWKHHAAQSHADRINAVAHERGEPWIGRYGGKISAEWQFAKGAAAARGGPRGLPPRGAVDRGGRLDHLAAVRARDAQRRAPPATRASTRTGATRRGTTWPPLNPDFADFVDKLDHPLSPLGERAGGLTAEAAGWTGLPEGSRSPSATSTPT